MNTRIAITVTAKVYLGPDIDLSGTSAPAANRYPETTQQVTLVEVADYASAEELLRRAAIVATRAATGCAAACGVPVFKAFKS